MRTQSELQEDSEIDNEAFGGLGHGWLFNEESECHIPSAVR